MDDTERPEGHDVVVTKGECPKCGSFKGFVTYADGHAHCYGAGCDYYVPAGGETTSTPKETFKRDYGELLDPSQQPDPYSPLSKRGLTSDTMKRFGVFQGGYAGKPVQVYPYHDQGGELVAQKLRTPAKDFPLLKGEGYKSLSECQLFGRHVFGDRFDRQVIVTEGELDALSVAQATNFKVAVVSVGAGSQSAAKHLKANYLWLDRFTEIILWFDNDEAGKQAVADCAPLFKVGKVRIATATGFQLGTETPCKDASDMLQANRPGDITAAVYAASGWRPKGIVNAKDNPEDVLAPIEEDSAFSFNWPWPELTDTLGPILPGQVCYHVAGTGIGKSTAVATIAFDVIKQGGKVGYLSFEGTRREIKLALMTVHSGKRVDITPLPDEDMRRLHDAAFGSGQMELFDPSNAEWSLEALEGYIRYLAKALDCHLIVIDPLSTMVAMLSSETDERRALDKISMSTSVAAKELGVHIQISHHLTRPHGIPHEEGAPTSLNEVRGSGGLANFATFVIGHERNQQAEGDDWMLTQLRSLKNRPRSKTGPMVVLEYSLETGQLTRSARKFPPPGKPNGEDKRSPGGFGPVGATDY